MEVVNDGQESKEVGGFRVFDFHIPSASAGAGMTIVTILLLLMLLYCCRKKILKFFLGRGHFPSAPPWMGPMTPPPQFVSPQFLLQKKLP